MCFHVHIFEQANVLLERKYFEECLTEYRSVFVNLKFRIDIHLSFITNNSLYLFCIFLGSALVIIKRHNLVLLKRSMQNFVYIRSVNQPTIIWTTPVRSFLCKYAHCLILWTPIFKPKSFKFNVVNAGVS